jgi:hypothetical protein
MDLFAVLPLEIVRHCLLRVPYDCHENLRAVCKSWEATVNHPQFYEDRKKLGGHCEPPPVICLVELREYLGYPVADLEFVVSLFDPLGGTKKTLPPLPYFPGSHNGIPLFCHCVCVNQKLVLMGGWNPSDFSSGKWSHSTPFSSTISLLVSGAEAQTCR